MLSPFIHEAGLLKHDFTAAERKEFETLCITLIGWEHKSITAQNSAKKHKKKWTTLLLLSKKLDFNFAIHSSDCYER